jgi:hypothetical protein
MSYNIARRIARKPKARESAKRCPNGTYFAVDIIQPAGGPMSLVSYSIGVGETLVDDKAQTAAAKLDKAWFESHPNRSHRIRHAVAGEAPGTTTTEPYVAVRQVVPGFRLRRFFAMAVPLPEDEAPEHIAHAFYDVLEEHPGGPIFAQDLNQRIHAYGLGADIEDPSNSKPPIVH